MTTVGELCRTLGLDKPDLLPGYCVAGPAHSVVAGRLGVTDGVDVFRGTLDWLDDPFGVNRLQQQLAPFGDVHRTLNWFDDPYGVGAVEAVLDSVAEGLFEWPAFIDLGSFTAPAVVGDVPGLARTVDRLTSFHDVLRPPALLDRAAIVDGLLHHLREPWTPRSLQVDGVGGLDAVADLTRRGYGDPARAIALDILDRFDDLDHPPPEPGALLDAYAAASPTATVHAESGERDFVVDAIRRLAEGVEALTAEVRHMSARLDRIPQTPAGRDWMTWYVFVVTNVQVMLGSAGVNPDVVRAVWIELIDLARRLQP